MSAIWDFIVGLFGYVMQFCYRISFDNYALALLFYALFFKILFLPFAIKQQKSQIKMAKLRPKMAAIEKKYQGRTDRATLQKKQEEMMELQQKEGYSPFSGCLPLLIQMPIIIALFSIIRQPLTYISRLTADQITALSTHFELVGETAEKLQIAILNAINNAESLDAVKNIIGDAVLPNLRFLGINFAETPSLTAPSLALVIPFLVFAAQFFSMKLMRKFGGGANPAMEMTPEAKMSNTIMDLAMPAMTFGFAFTFSAAIGVYWIYQSVLGLLQSFLLSKIMPLPHYTDEEIREMQRAEKRRMQEARASKKTSPYSLHHIDDDDDEDVVVPEIRSKYDEDDEGTALPAPEEQNKNAFKSNPHHTNKNSKKKH